MPWTPTTDQILNLDGVRRRCDRFRFELCDRDHNPIGELHPDRSTSVPSIQNDTSSNTSRRLSGFKLLPGEEADVDTVKDRVRVYMVLQNGVEFLMGTFMWADESRPKRSWGDESHSELVDYTYILDKPTTRGYGFGKGGKIILVMIFLLHEAGFELHDLFPFGLEAQRSLVDIIGWEPGATWLTHQTDLGALVAFASPWFDRTGLMHHDTLPNPLLDPPTVPAYELDTRIIADSLLYSNDLLGAPNDFGVFDSANEGQMRSGRYQLPASAPHSFQNRGFRIGDTENVQGLSSQGMADARAKQRAQEGDVYEYATWQSPIDPRHDTHDIVPLLGTNWLETGWSAELRSGGKMQHTAKRPLYDVV